MPCKDTTAKITIFLDENDCLHNFIFSKISCDKEIGGDTGFLDYCRGKSTDEIVDLKIDELFKSLCPKTEEDEFLLFMEWEALQAGISQLLGASNNNKRYQISSINSDKKGTTINQVMYPLKEMPKIDSCFKRQKKTLN